MITVKVSAHNNLHTRLGPGVAHPPMITVKVSAPNNLHTRRRPLRAKFWRVVTVVGKYATLSRTRKCTRMRARAHTRTRMRARAHPHSLIRKSDPPHFSQMCKTSLHLPSPRPRLKRKRKKAVKIKIPLKRILDKEIKRAAGNMCAVSCECE